MFPYALQHLPISHDTSDQCLRPRAGSYRAWVRRASAVLIGTAVALGPALPLSAATRVHAPSSEHRSVRLVRPSVPAVNVAPQPNFLDSGTCSKGANGWGCTNPCVTPQLTWPVTTNDSGCSAYIVNAISRARGLEHLPALVLPKNWYQLNTPEQLFVIADLERTARGLPPYLGLNAALSANALLAARHNADPSIARGFAVGLDAQGVPGFGGAWAGGFSVLAADYFWMYADGWGGSTSLTSNVMCTSAGAPGCWSHREELLGSDPHYNPGVGLYCTTCEMGTGYALVNGSGSYVDLIEIAKARPPKMTFTWARNVVPYL